MYPLVRRVDMPDFECKPSSLISAQRPLFVILNKRHMTEQNYQTCMEGSLKRHHYQCNWHQQCVKLHQPRYRVWSQMTLRSHPHRQMSADLYMKREKNHLVCKNHAQVLTSNGLCTQGSNHWKDNGF